MKRINKILLWLIAVIFSLFIIANIAVSVFAKQIVVKQIEQNLKTPAKLGRIGVTFPLSINLYKLEIGNLFKADEIAVSPNLLGFLAGKIVLSGVTLVNPQINLQQSNDGSLNLPKLEQKGKPPEIYLTSLSIKSGKIIFTDNKIIPAGYKIILGQLNVHIAKVMLPITSLKANFKASADILNSAEKKLGSVSLSGWLDFGPKDMDAVFNVEDLDATYFAPYYGNFISEKKLLSATVNVESTFKAKNNNLDIANDFKLSHLVYAPVELAEGQVAQLDLTRNALDFFTDSKGNLNLEFEINTKLDHPSVGAEQLKKVMLKAAAKNLANQSPEELIQKVSDNIEQFKAIGKSLKNIFSGKE